MRAPIPDLRGKLSTHQNNVLAGSFEADRSLVIGPGGVGKTELLVAWAAAVLGARAPGDSRRILFVTFTKIAARATSRPGCASISPVVANRVRVVTFDELAHEMACTFRRRGINWVKAHELREILTRYLGKVLMEAYPDYVTHANLTVRIGHLADLIGRGVPLDPELLAVAGEAIESIERRLVRRGLALPSTTRRILAGVPDFVEAYLSKRYTAVAFEEANDASELDLDVLAVGTLSLPCLFVFDPLQALMVFRAVLGDVRIYFVERGISFFEGHLVEQFRAPAINVAGQSAPAAGSTPASRRW